MPLTVDKDVARAAPGRAELSGVILSLDSTRQLSALLHSHSHSHCHARVWRACHQCRAVLQSLGKANLTPLRLPPHCDPVLPCPRAPPRPAMRSSSAIHVSPRTRSIRYTHKIPQTRATSFKQIQFFCIFISKFALCIVHG